MKILTRLFVLLTAVAGSALFAQDRVPAPTVTTAPPPPPPAAEAPEQVRVDGLIHVQRLPSPAQLTADAEAEGMTVTRMEQQDDRIIVSYRYASGNTRTFAYTTTVPANPDTEIGSAPSTPAPAAAPNYTVIYSEPAPVYYSTRYVRTYDPYWATPSLSIGLGFGSGYYGYSRPRYYTPSYRGHYNYRGHYGHHGRHR